jgi:hypothetical protein
MDWLTDQIQYNVGKYNTILKEGKQENDRKMKLKRKRELEFIEEELEKRIKQEKEEELQASLKEDGELDQQIISLIKNSSS